MGCRQVKAKEQQDPMPLINMLIVGLTGSGKSTILNQLKGEPEATCDVELGIDSFILNKKLKVIAFEVAGRAINSWHNYYCTSNLVLFVVDASEPIDRSRIQSILGEMDSQLDSRAKIIMVYNKIDKLIHKPQQPIGEEVSNLTMFLDGESEQVRALDRVKFKVESHEIFTCKCSGKDKIGLNSLLKKIYSLSMQQVYGNEETSDK